MIVVDIMIALFVLGLLVIGAPLIAVKLLAMSPKRKALEAAREMEETGETNTVKFNLEQLRRCQHCHKMTDPNKDLRSAETWVHLNCYLEAIDPNKKGNS